MAERKPTYDELAALVEQQAELIEKLQRRIAELEQQLQEASRQAGPFRRRDALKKPPADQKKPGRLPGHEGHYRQRPEVIDEQIEVPLPCCPHCEAELSDLRRREQFIEEIPPLRPICIKLTTWTGMCNQCGREVESTHPLQTSTATGAAGTHLGPRAQALAVTLSHRTGLTMGRTCQVFQDLCGLKLSRGGLSQLLHRSASRMRSYHEQIQRQIRESAAVFADETSWYVGQPGWWLWTFTTPTATLYRVERSRGSDIVRQTLGDEFAGMLVSDCLTSYNPIDCRKHKCIAHHLRVLAEARESLLREGVESPELLLWKMHFQNVITTWNQRSELQPATYARKVLQLRRGLTKLLERSPPHAVEVAFRNRLLRQRDHLHGCLAEPAAEPTNNRAERELRPAVIDRKLSCGNRTERGKSTWEILRSVVVTLYKQDPAPLDTLTASLRLSST